MSGVLILITYLCANLLKKPLNFAGKYQTEMGPSTLHRKITKAAIVLRNSILSENPYSSYFFSK